MRKLIAAAALSLAANAQAFTFSIYTSLANWEAQAGTSTLQDFSSYADGSPVLGSEVLPGVTASTNLGALAVHGAQKDIFATGTGASSRATGDAYYQFDVGNHYRAAALEVGAYESALAPFGVPGGAVLPGTVEVLFENGFSVGYQLFANDGNTNVFFGIWSDVAITRVRWLEGHESSGGNEETTVDNLRVAAAVNRVPEPSSLLLAAPALLMLRRRRAAAA